MNKTNTTAMVKLAQMRRDIEGYKKRIAELENIILNQEQKSNAIVKNKNLSEYIQRLENERDEWKRASEGWQERNAQLERDLEIAREMPYKKSRIDLGFESY